MPQNENKLRNFQFFNVSSVYNKSFDNFKNILIAMMSLILVNWPNLNYVNKTMTGYIEK